MRYIGMVPAEYYSGELRQRGSIIKPRNVCVKAILVEAAWNYRFFRHATPTPSGAVVSSLDDDIKQIAWDG